MFRSYFFNKLNKNYNLNLTLIKLPKKYLMMIYFKDA